MIETTLHNIAEFFRSPTWSIIQVLLNWLTCYLFWRLGRTRGRLEVMKAENKLLEVQHNIILRMHHTLTVGKAHMENLRARLAEARK